MLQNPDTDLEKKKSLLAVVYFSIYAFTGYTTLGAVQKLECTLSAKKTITKP